MHYSLLVTQTEGFVLKWYTSGEQAGKMKTKDKEGTI